ncbi:ABC transporter permease [Niveispirillum cyanobacteriorum]|uniref:ABC transporter permease n=1 Tax=Niveispirillum cyanobacteriorum TaxID=1612173 RepID=A0A2K9NFT7_9PROT|nr:FtsX-like permease family protein [Niveispirillum cyanobacteriorum]AUN31115.1 ABC transporter permease [Niveispirillum cyanobacteriorum]GGE84679.1 membrane protein [Niveispirillum cyanobacteriorum]
MTDFSLILANLFSRKLRAILMLVAIFFAFLIFGVLAGVQNGFNNIGGAAGENRLVTINKINFTQPLPISYVERVRATEGVARASYANWFGGYFQEGKNQIVTFAIDPESYLDIYATDYKLTPEERAAFLADRSSVLIGRKLAERWGWKLGDRIPLSSNIFTNKNTGKQTWELTVAGIMQPAQENADTSVAFFHHSNFNESVTFGRDTAGWIIIETADKKLNTDVSKRIDAMFANSAAETATDTEKAFNQAFVGQLGNITLIVTLVVGAAFATILMIVGNTMVMAVRERTKEIGVMKTLGFPSGRIFKMVLGESLLLSLLGGLPALGTAAVLLELMRAAVGIPGLALTLNYAVLGVAIMLALGLLTGIIPAWNALRLNIVTALGRQ